MDNGLIKALQNNIKVSNSSNTTYNGLTNAGSQYLAKCLANKTGVTFTKIKVGNGSIPSGSTGQDTTDLYGFKKEIEILEKAQVENAIKLTVLLNNIDLEAGFYVKELGVYIQDGEEEKLYWYINKANPSYLPDKNTPSSHRYNLYLEVSPIETTIVNFTGQGLLADKKYVDDSIKNFQTENNEVIKQLQNAIDGKAAKEHKHNISDINEFPTSMKNPNSLKIKLNNVEKVTYDGETAKEINITAGDVGALEKGAGLPSTIQSNEDLYNLVQNTMGCKMDKNLLYLNDRGVKTKGYVYFDKNKTGLFECIKTTTEDYVINSTEYFVEYGAKQNSDRLSNLIKFHSLEYKYSETPSKFSKIDDLGNGRSVYEILISDELRNIIKNHKILSILVGSNGGYEGFSYEENTRVFCAVRPDALKDLIINVTVSYI